MFNISNIGNHNKINNNQANNKTQIHYNKTLKADTVSFGSKAKAVQYGTDAILDAIRKCSQLLAEGKDKLVTDAVSLMQAGKINEALAQLNEIAPPNGAIETIENGTKILARNWDGSPIEHVFKHVDGFQNLGLVRKLDDTGRIEILEKAFGTAPKTTTGMVGWTNIKPENVLGGSSLTKAELTQKYEEAIREFYEPIDKYFVKGIGINPSDRALASSVSYSGVDKAIMDLGQGKGINTLTVTPFDYSIYGRSEHPFPTLITDTIPQYVDVYGKLSDNIVVTGGRDHAFKFDAGGKWLKQNNGLVIPVDVLKDYKGIIIPGTINGKIENAAAAAYDTFSDPMPAGLIESFKDLPSDILKQDLQHPAQKALAVAMWNNLIQNGFKP